MRFLLGLVFAVLVSAQTSSPDSLLQQGLALARADRFAEAEGVFREGRSRFPNDARFPLELAGVRYRLKDNASAKRALHQALHLDPSSDYGNGFLANLYLLDGNLPAAVKYWNRIGKPVLGGVRFDPVPMLEPFLRERIPGASAGQLLTLRRLDRTETNLERLTIFSDYSFELSPRADDRFDLTIRTVARAGPVGRWWWWLLPYLRGLPYQQVNADFYNLGGTTTNLLSMGRWDVNKRRVLVALSGPFGTSRYRVAMDARDERWDLRRTYRAETNVDGVIVRRVEAGGELIFIVGDRVQWTAGIWASRRQFANRDDNPAFANGWMAEIRNRFDVRLFDWPEARLRVDGWALLRTGRILSNAPSRLISPQAGALARWFPQAPGEKYEAIGQIRAGRLFGKIPLDEMFMLGMERDNDLWLRGHIGTHDGRKGNSPLGSEFFLVNTELNREILRIPFVRIQVGPFFDAGNLGAAQGGFGSRGPLYDTGIQLKIATLGGVKLTAVYGRDLRNGRPAFYTAVSR